MVEQLECVGGGVNQPIWGALVIATTAEKEYKRIRAKVGRIDIFAARD